MEHYDVRGPVVKDSMALGLAAVKRFEFGKQLPMKPLTGGLDARLPPWRPESLQDPGWSLPLNVGLSVVSAGGE